jgi:hypothetical protein
VLFSRKVAKTQRKTTLDFATLREILKIKGAILIAKHIASNYKIEFKNNPFIIQISH